MHTIMTIYPPGEAYQRGEERCQISIEYSVANSNRACNDLGYICAVLKGKYNCFLRDYQGEKLSFEHLKKDIIKNNPDIVFISTTNGSVRDDIEIVRKIKKIKNDVIIILKGAVFFNPPQDLFSAIDFSNTDYLIGGEAEFIVDKLLHAHFYDKKLLKEIEGIAYKQDGVWQINKMVNFCDCLDDLPFPDRNLMKNDLYINPETNKPMALIKTAKGCCYSCKYCLSPVISGKKIRCRSAKSIFAEIKDCVENHNITEFFFKSDTFTVNKKNVLELCQLIKNEKYDKKINWVATSRVDTIDEETVKNMKEAGCSLLAIGFESGNDETLSKIGKNTTTEKNLSAAKLCKKYGIEIFGYFLVGFPWENEFDLKNTEKHIFETDADYIEISVIVPFLGTELFSELSESDKNIKITDILGKDSYQKLCENYSALPASTIQQFRKNVLLKYYTRPKYILKKISSIRSLGSFMNYAKYGLRMLKNVFLR